VCVTRVRKSGVFLLLSFLSILSTFFPSFRLGLHCVCPSTVLPAFRTTTLYSCCVNFVICAVNFLYFRARYFVVIPVFFGGSCSEPTLWNTGAGFLPSCRRAIFSFVLKIHFRPAAFDGDDSISSSILRGFLTAADISCSLAL
jgi:hypothetical protein